ncbi:serine O-acetyltransferase EpsC [Marivirga harenae]|uniref:serine O-acetyltransferase EpsC n=1 Tax=Marivirga harenae TaxID=2010992 RepID=UPI0026E027A4|nr:serine O-acetyltransferase EpsC [Marivirga harenae]WKV11989.1 serine O-acetyltransferase EpsC [Marivirga harenae]|tara:strand:+ start:96634 stop:97446 length:813 start_codon:yes stop_codon:yes gene_type:complete
MEEGFLDNLYQEHQTALGCPSPSSIIAFYESLVGFLFPDYGNEKITTRNELKNRFGDLRKDWHLLLQKRCKSLQKKYPGDEDVLFKDLTKIKSTLENDITAIYEGDPAAQSRLEVIKTYPGFKAIAAYRIANSIYNSGYQLIARMISEHAHSRTGVDIHPAAKIGSHFCIDHGTGIVIGETTDIGDHVKIYQGVTLGATSVKKENASQKRHPTIGNNVVIYANATILGGKTHIGDHCVIGGNSWITRSLESNSRLYYDSENKHLLKSNLE